MKHCCKGGGLQILHIMNIIYSSSTTIGVQEGKVGKEEGNKKFQGFTVCLLLKTHHTVSQKYNHQDFEKKIPRI